jgi:hypothetical protein
MWQKNYQYYSQLMCLSIDILVLIQKGEQFLWVVFMYAGYYLGIYTCLKL